MLALVASLASVPRRRRRSAPGARALAARLRPVLTLAAMVFTAAALGGAAAAMHPTAPEDFEPGEILAADADPWFVPHARKLGFVPVETIGVILLVSAHSSWP